MAMQELARKRTSVLTSEDAIFQSGSLIIIRRNTQDWIVADTMMNIVARPFKFRPAIIVRKA
jgi:hypothetical protein